MYTPSLSAAESCGQTRGAANAEVLKDFGLTGCSKNCDGNLAVSLNLHPKIWESLPGAGW